MRKRDREAQKMEGEAVKEKGRDDNWAHELHGTKTESNRNPPIALASDDARPTRTNDTACTEPLIHRMSGIEVAVVPATRGMGVGRYWVRV